MKHHKETLEEMLHDEAKADAVNDRIGESREGLDKCSCCKQWSVDQRNDKCMNEDCGEHAAKQVEDAKDMLAERGE